MEFEEMIKRFTEISNYEGYVADLNNFKSYLLNKEECEKVSITVLGGIRTKDIIDSITYHISQDIYNSKSIALKYMSAIAQFYRYAINKNWLTNDNLLNDINKFNSDEDSYYYKINSYISNNKKLKIKNSKDKYTENEISLLIDTIDDFINHRENHDDKIGFERLSVMISIKLMILTGIKYKVLKEIKLNDYDPIKNIILINGFSIRLPIRLSTQFQHYYELRNQISTELYEYLFTDYEGNKWGDSTSQISYLLSRYTGRRDTIGIIKYAILNLINVGTGISEIEKITGAGKDIIRGCIPPQKDAEKEEMDKYINKHISNMDIYYRL